MPLRVLDGNQTATTLSSVVTGGEHIVAHTVVSLGPTAISNIASAVSGSVVSISNFPSTQTIAGTVTANLPALNWNTVKITYGEKTVLNGIYKKGSSGYVDAGGGGTPEYLPIDGFFVGGTIPKLTRGTYPGGPLPFTETRWYFTSDGDVQFYSTTTATDLRVIADWTDSGGPEADVQIAPYSVEPVAIPNGVGIAYSGSTEAPSLVTNSNPFPVKVQNSVTIGSLPAIFGTVTARLQDASGNNLTSTSIGGVQRLNVSLASAATPGGSLPSFVNVYGGSDGSAVRTISVDSTGRQNTNVQLPRVTFIDGSGTVTTANTAITVFASSSTRSYLLVQVTTGSAFVNVGATATTVNGINLTAGQGYAWENTIPQGIVSLISTTTSSRYVAKEA